MAQPTVISIDLGSTTVDATSFITNTRTFKAGKLYLIHIFAEASAGFTSTTAALTVDGSTWLSIASATQGTVQKMRIATLAFMPNADITDSITIDFASTTITGFEWITTEITGTDVTITRSILQSKSAVGSTAAPTATLDAAPAANSVTIGVSGRTKNATYTAGAGFTKLQETPGHLTPESRLAVEVDNGTPLQTAAWTTAVAASWGAQVLEIKSGKSFTFKRAGGARGERDFALSFGRIGSVLFGEAPPGASGGIQFGTMGFTNYLPGALELTPAPAFYRASSLNGLGAQPLPTTDAQAAVDQGFKLVQTLRNSAGTQGRPQVTVTAIQRNTPSAGKVTFTTNPAHGLNPGDLVRSLFNTVPGDPTGYDAEFLVESVPAPNKIVFTHPDVGTPDHLGSICYVSVYPDDTANGGQGYTAYEDMITDWLTAIGPENVEYLVLENEGSIPKQTNYGQDPTAGPFGPYSVMMQHAITAAHALDVKVTNDGIVSELVRASTYVNFLDNGDPVGAARYKTVAHVSTATAATQSALCRLWMDETIAGGADAINIHIYHLTDTQGIQDTVAHVQEYTGLPVITNELGQQVGSLPPDVDTLFNGLVNSGMILCILYAQGGQISEALREDTDIMPLTILGQQWADDIAAMPDDSATEFALVFSISKSKSFGRATETDTPGSGSISKGRKFLQPEGESDVAFSFDVVLGGSTVHAVLVGRSEELDEAFQFSFFKTTRQEHLIWISSSGDAFELTKDADDVLVMWGVEGRYMPPFATIETNKPYTSGATLRDIHADVREIDIPIFVAGTTRAQRHEKLRAWTQRFNPLFGPGKLRNVAEDGTIREITCWYQNGFELNESNDSAGITWQSALLVFRARDPFWYGTDQRQVTFVGVTPATFFPFFPLRLSSSEVFSQKTIINLGDDITWPIWTIFGPGSDPTIINTTTEDRLELEGVELTLGEYVVVDTRPGFKTVMKQDGTNLFSTLSDDSSLWSLPIGASSVQVQMTNAADDTKVTANWYDKFFAP